MGGTSRQRNSRIELLRIISMCFIVLSHFSAHGGFQFDTAALSVNRLWTQFIILGNIGIGIFVMISGYFLLDSKQIKAERVLKIWLQVFFYSVGIYLIMCLCGRAAFTPVGLLKSCSPILQETWWFASAYFLLYLLHPYLNLFIHGLSRKAHTSLLALLTVLWSVIPTFTNLPAGCNNLLWFIYLYLLAGWIKLYFKKKNARRPALLAVIAVALVLLFASTVLIDLVGLKHPAIGRLGNLFYAQRSVLIVCISLCAFLFAVSCEPRSNKAINSIAATTFGIYLIHDHPLVRELLWQDVFRNAAHAESAFLIPYTLFAVASVLATASALEWVRAYVEKRWVSPPLRRLCAKIEKLTERFSIE